MEHLEFLDSRQLPIPELIEDLEEENARVKKLHLTEMEYSGPHLEDQGKSYS